MMSVTIMHLFSHDRSCRTAAVQVPDPGHAGESPLYLNLAGIKHPT